MCNACDETCRKTHSLLEHESAMFPSIHLCTNNDVGHRDFGNGMSPHFRIAKLFFCQKMTEIQDSEANVIVAVLGNRCPASTQTDSAGIRSLRRKKTPSCLTFALEYVQPQRVEPARTHPCQPCGELPFLFSLNDRESLAQRIPSDKGLL